MVRPGPGEKKAQRKEGRGLPSYGLGFRGLGFREGSVLCSSLYSSLTT